METSGVVKRSCSRGFSKTPCTCSSAVLWTPKGGREKEGESGGNFSLLFIYLFASCCVVGFIGCRLVKLSLLTSAPGTDNLPSLEMLVLGVIELR